MRYEKGKILSFKQKFEQKGIDDGSRQIPALDAEIDNNESELLMEGTTCLRAIEDYHDKHLQSQKINFSGLKDSWEESQTKNSFVMNVDDSLASLDNSLEACFRKRESELEDIGRKVIDSNGEVNKFKLENKISRQAVYPISYKKAAAIMCSIVVAESLINAYSHQGEGGLIDGAGIAFFISAVNVMIAAFLGRWFTRINHISMAKKVIGWTAFAAFLISTIYLNSLYATFRTELHKILDEESEVTVYNPDEKVKEGQANQVPATVVDNNADNYSAQEILDAKKNPTKVAFIRALRKAWRIFYLEVPFNDLLSYLTFFLTIIFSVVAFYEGYNLDDPYPGYGKISRHNKELRDREDEAWKLFVPELEIECIQAQMHYSQRADMLSMVSPTILLNLATQLESKKLELESDVNALNSELETVASNYRHTNSLARGDGKIPKAFTKGHPKVKLNEVDKKYVETMAEIKAQAAAFRAQFEELYRRLSAEKEEFRKKSNTALHNKINKLKEQTLLKASGASSQIARG